MFHLFIGTTSTLFLCGTWLLAQLFRAFVCLSLSLSSSHSHSLVLVPSIPLYFYFIRIPPSPLPLHLTPSILPSIHTLSLSHTIVFVTSGSLQPTIELLRANPTLPAIIALTSLAHVGAQISIVSLKSHHGIWWKNIVTSLRKVSLYPYISYTL